MTRRLLGLAVATSLAASCDYSQPSIGCPVQSLTWAATYKPKGTSTCGEQSGEQLGIQKFSSPDGSERLAITPETYTLPPFDADTTNLSYSLGDLARNSDAEGFCAATNLAPSQKYIPPVGGDIPPLRISYSWSNVRILATARAPGTQMVADVEITRNGCAAQYEVWALWPGDIDCKNEAGAADDGLCAKAATINPDFATVCDPTQFRCVPARRPPSVK